MPVLAHKSVTVPKRKYNPNATVKASRSRGGIVAARKCRAPEKASRQVISVKAESCSVTAAPYRVVSIIADGCKSLCARDTNAAVFQEPQTHTSARVYAFESTIAERKRVQSHS